MQKIIKLETENTPLERWTENSACEIYSHDTNNGQFEIEVMNEALTDETVTALFIFEESQSVWRTTGTIEENKIKFKFDTTLITQDETVVCVLYLDNERENNDFYRFNFKVKVSEIDKLDNLTVKERFFKNNLIVDRLDVVTKTELQEILKTIDLSNISTDGLLTEEKANGLYAKISELEALERQIPSVSAFITEDTLRTAKNDVIEEINNRLGNYALKTNIPEPYNDTNLVNRVSDLEQRQDKDTIYNDEPIKERLRTLENSNFATKEELANIYQMQHRDLSNYALKTEIPQPYNDTVLVQKIGQLEAKVDNDTIYDDTPLKERVTALESKAIEGGAYDDSDLRSRVVALESKEDKDTIYNDTELRNRVTELENKPPLDISNFVTNQVLESKNYITEEILNNKGFAKTSEIPAPYNDSEVKERLTVLENKQDNDTVYNDSELRTRVSELEQRPIATPYNDTALSDRVTALETKVDKDTVYNDEPIKERLTALESKTNVDLKDYETFKNMVVTKGYLEKQKFLTEQYNDKPLTDRVVALETRAGDFATKEELHEATEIDYSNIVTTDELEPYAKKNELPTPYNDSALVSRVTALESKPTTNQTLSIDNNTLSISNGNSVTLPTNQFEIHGTGMPNGVVTAEIGTTYVDMNKTNGALKWIKTTNGGNTGWRVFTGDTGWRTLPLINKRGNARLQIRRINDEVIVKFDGLSWGWFGVDDLSKQAGNIVDKTIAGKQYTWIKLNIGQGNNVLPVGFRSASSLLSGLYGDLGDLLGSVYVGGTADSNAIQLRYAMARNELNSNVLSQIRISPVTFITDDEWPTKLL